MKESARYEYRQFHYPSGFVLVFKKIVGKKKKTDQSIDQMLDEAMQEAGFGPAVPVNYGPHHRPARKRKA